MDVTKNNFKEAFELLSEKISAADFISIDAEFSGLSTIKGPRFSYNTLTEEYARMKTGSDQFLILQYGICLFTWNSNEEKYNALPFAFNIFPRPYKRFFNDVMFKVQSSCLDFLSQNDFDFNKLFYGGISFIHPTTERKVNDKFTDASNFITKKENRLSNSSSELKPITKSIPKEESKVFIPKDKREFIENVMNSVEKFVIDAEQDSIDLSPCTPFERKLIYEVLEEKYPMGLYLKSETNEKKEKFIQVVKVTGKGKSLKFQEDMKKESDLFHEVGAFNRVMKLLTESKKPIIGHNMSLDLFYTVTNFFAVAPDSLPEYKAILSGLFPLIFDTKVISNTQPLSGMCTHGTGLKNLTETIGNDLAPADIILDPSLEGCEEMGNYHDAGYDALCTGKCFISLTRSLMMHFDKGDGPIDMTGNLIKPFQNRIFVMGIQDINYMSVHKEDEMPSRKGVYLVKFPSDWKETNLHNLFSPISKLFHPIVWLNDTSAHVSIQDKTKHNEVVNKFVNNRTHSDVFQVIPFPEKSVADSVESKQNDSDPEDGEISSDDSDVADNGAEKGDIDGNLKSGLKRKQEFHHEDAKESNNNKPASKKPALFQMSEDW